MYGISWEVYRFAAGLLYCAYRVKSSWPWIAAVISNVFFSSRPEGATEDYCLEYNLFQSGTWPSADFRADLKELIELSDSDLVLIRDWFLSAQEFIFPDWPDYAEAVRRSTLTVEQFERYQSVIQYVLSRWHAQTITIEQVTEDFQQLGLTKEKVGILSDFFKSLAPVAQRAYLDGVRSFHENIVLPTIDDASFICDLRPYFADPAYESRPMGPDCAKLLGFSAVYLMELVASSLNGQKQHFTCQLTERDFDHLLESMTRAKQQFQVLSKVKSLAEKSLK